MKNKPADPQISNVGNTPSAPGAKTPISSHPGQHSRGASDTASGVKAKAAKIAGSAASTARSKASSLSDQVEHQAESAVDSVISRVHEGVDASKDQASGYVSSFGRALKAASESLEDDGLTMPASYVRAAANGLDQAANEVDGFDTGSITSNVEHYVRGNPMLAVAGMTLAGFVLTKLIGSSRRR